MAENNNKHKVFRFSDYLNVSHPPPTSYFCQTSKLSFPKCIYASRHEYSSKSSTLRCHDTRTNGHSVYAPKISPLSTTGYKLVQPRRKKNNKHSLGLNTLSINSSTSYSRDH